MTSVSNINKNKFSILVNINQDHNEMANLKRSYVKGSKWFYAKEQDFLNDRDFKLKFEDGTVFYYNAATKDKPLPISIGYVQKSNPKDLNNIIIVDSIDKFNTLFVDRSGKDPTKSIPTSIQSQVYKISRETSRRKNPTTDLILNEMLNQLESWEKMFKSLKTTDVSLILKPSTHTRVVKIKNKIESPPKLTTKKVKFADLDDDDVNCKKIQKTITECDGKEGCKCKKWWCRTIRDDSNCDRTKIYDEDKRILQFCSYSCASTREEDLYAYEN
jgi:hypothetical protein